MPEQIEATEIVNESQETMFDTKLTKAADTFTKACLEVEAWKRRKIDAEKNLISEMKRTNITLMNMPQNKQLKYTFQDAKEKVTLKDFKPKTKKLRGGRNGERTRY